VFAHVGSIQNPTDPKKISSEPEKCNLNRSEFKVEGKELMVKG
jgi:hypothetical protein